MDANYNDRIKVDSRVANTGLLAHDFKVYAAVGLYDEAAFRKYSGLPIVLQQETLHLDPDEVKASSVIGRILPASGSTLYAGGLNYVLYMGVSDLIRAALASIIDALIVVWYNTPDGVWQAFNPTAPDWANDLTNMVSGGKYWIAVSRNISSSLFALINTELYPPGIYDVICGVLDETTNRLVSFDVRLGAVNLLAPPQPA